jgi:dipeptide/tripeptide permease
MAVGWTAGSILSSGWAGHGTRRAIMAGPILILLGLATLAVFFPVEGAGAWAVLTPICTSMILVGFGIGLGWPHIATRVFQEAPAAEQDLAAGVMAPCSSSPQSLARPPREWSPISPF